MYVCMYVCMYVRAHTYQPHIHDMHGMAWHGRAGQEKHNITLHEHVYTFYTYTYTHTYTYIHEVDHRCVHIEDMHTNLVRSSASSS